MSAVGLFVTRACPLYEHGTNRVIGMLRPGDEVWVDCKTPDGRACAAVGRRASLPERRGWLDASCLSRSPSTGRTLPIDLDEVSRAAYAYARSSVEEWARRQSPEVRAALDTPPIRCVLRAPLRTTNADGVYGTPHPPGTVFDVYTAMIQRGTDGAALYNVSRPGILTFLPIFARIEDVRIACGL